MVSKKAQWFAPLFVMVVIILLVMTGIQLVKERVSIKKGIGEIQGEMLQQDRSMQLLTPYIKTSGELAVAYGIYDWGSSGLFVEPPCGTYAGSAIWQDRVRKGCFPHKPWQALSRHIEGYASRYVEALSFGDPGYEVSIVGKQVLGVPLGKIHSPLSEKRRQQAIDALPSEEQACLSRDNEVPLFENGRFVGCGECRGSCNDYLLPYCNIDPCGHDCVWTGESCVDDTGVSISLQPSFETELDFEPAHISGLLDAIHAFMDDVSMCSGSLDQCVQKGLSNAEPVLGAIDDGLFLLPGEACENGEEEWLNDFAERIADCVLSADADCYCTATAPTFEYEELEIVPDDTAGILHVKDEQGKVFRTSSIPAPLSTTLGQGEQLLFFKDDNRLVTGQEADMLRECTVRHRWRRFCAKMDISTSHYDPLEDYSYEEQLQIPFAAYFPDIVPPSPVLSTEAVDFPRAERLLLVSWTESPEDDIALYKVYVAEEDFSESPTGDIEAVEMVELLKASIVPLGKTIGDECIFEELGKPCVFTVTDQDNKEVKVPILEGGLYRVGDRLYTAVGVPRDDAVYHLGITAVDADGNEIDNVQSKIKIVSAASEDDLPPGKAGLFNGPDLEQSGLYSFSIRLPEFNSDGSTIVEASVVARVLYGRDCNSMSTLITKEGAPTKLVSTSPVLIGAGNYCLGLVIEDEKGNPIAGNSAYPLLLTTKTVSVS
ncbi:MAG: hypothetical protein ABIH34_04915 [Nanoarchaeota archaeon]